MIFDGWKTLTLHLKTCFTQLKCYEKFFFLVNFALFAQAWNREGVGSFVTGRSFVRRHRSALFFSPWPLLAGLPVFCPRWEAKQEEKEGRGEVEFSSPGI